MIKPLKEYLARFIQLSDAELSQVGEIAEIRRYDKKVRMVDIGEEEEYFNFVVRGLVRKFFMKKKEEVITQIAREGELICSSVSFLSGGPSLYAVETIEPTTFVSFRRENIEMLYARDRKWQRLGRLIITDLFLQQQTWDLECILYSTRERFTRFLNEHSVLFQRVPQKYLASYLNIKPETFSRLKHTLRTKSASNPLISL